MLCGIPQRRMFRQMAFMLPRAPTETVGQQLLQSHDKGQQQEQEGVELNVP
jgi:hypothetical protein